jgi:probable rRNA maturation factor
MTLSENLDSNDHQININAADTIDEQLLATAYDPAKIQQWLTTVLAYMDEQMQAGLVLPYFEEIDPSLWQTKAKELDIYITDSDEGRELNLEARGKDYATNILSYPSELPPFILAEMPTLPLGELIICHTVVEQQAVEQGKPLADHITHLIVHGILHLLGFDHELGATEQTEMEGFEIAILAQLGVADPYQD